MLLSLGVYKFPMMKSNQVKTYKTVKWLAVFTIVYNIAEGLLSVYFGFRDETLALFGFGTDSFVEMISGFGILIMVLRMEKKADSSAMALEKTALKITGTGFYILATGLIAGAILNVYFKHKPDSTLWGILISAFSIAIMLWLYYAKLKTGQKLKSDPIIADARCTIVCIYMSVVLLISSLLFHWFGFGYFDSLGAIGLAWFSFREGQEAFEKVKNNTCSCGHCK